MNDSLSGKFGSHMGIMADQVGSRPDLERAVAMLQNAAGILRTQLNQDANARNRSSSPSNQLLLNTSSPGPSSAGVLPGPSRGHLFSPLISGTTMDASTGEFAIRHRNILEETRRAFAPYNCTPGSRTNRRQGSAGRTQAATRQRLWHGRIFCLGGPVDTVTPGGQRRGQLGVKGLGLTGIHIRYDADAQTLRETICSTFPALVGKDFEILRSVCGGHGKELVRVSREHKIPNVLELSTVVLTSIAYIRPLATIEEDEDDQLGSNTTNGSVDTSIHQHLVRDMVPGEPTTSNSSAFIDLTEDISSNDFSNTASAGTNVVSDIDMNVGDDPITVLEWRDKLYSSYQPGDVLNIFLQRSDYTASLLGVYKKPNLDLYKPIEVMFAGESGADAGALTKEYFWCGITSLTTEKFNNRLPIFEGDTNAKLPSCDTSLLRADVFLNIGKFMLHSAIHTGVAFIGLSPVFVEYMLQDRVDVNTQLEINVTDVPDFEIRHAIEILDKWGQNIVPAQAEVENLTFLAHDCGFFDVLTRATATSFREQMLYYHVIQKRKPQLDAIKAGFKDDKLASFLQGKDYLFKSLFPSWDRFCIPASMVVCKIQSNDEMNPVTSFVKHFIEEKLDGKSEIKDLLVAWSGWGELPSSPLKLIVCECEYATVRACTHELEMPRNLEKEQVFKNMERILDNRFGFGNI